MCVCEYLCVLSSSRLVPSFLPLSIADKFCLAAFANAVVEFGVTKATDSWTDKQTIRHTDIQRDSYMAWRHCCYFKDTHTKHLTINRNCLSSQIHMCVYYTQMCVYSKGVGFEVLSAFVGCQSNFHTFMNLLSSLSCIFGVLAQLNVWCLTASNYKTN